MNYTFFEKTIILSIIFLILALLFNTIYIFNGNKFYYLIFSILSNSLLFISLSRNRSFFEIFFSLLLWLGFWFKLSFVLSFRDYHKNGFFEYATSNFIDTSNIDSDLSQILLILSIVFFILNIFFILRKRILNFNFDSFYQVNNFNQKEKNLIYFFFINLIFIFIIIYINDKFLFFKKGILQNTNDYSNFFLILKWYLIFGFYSVFSFILFEFIKTAKKSTFFLILLVYFSCIYFVSISSNSRSMPLILIVIIVGIIFSFKNLNKNYNKFIFLLVVFFGIFLSYFSNQKVQQFRNINFYQSPNEDKVVTNLSTNLSNLVGSFFIKNYQSLNLFITRWVGIDSFIAVYQYKNKSFQIINDAINEKKIFSEPNFYLKKFIFKDQKYKYNDIQNNIYPIIIPGLISFLYYGGSLFFVIFAISLFYIFAIFLEFLSLKFSKSNYIFSSFLSFSLAYRYIHFGYVPFDSYKFLISLILSLLFIFLLNKTFDK